MSWLSGDEVHAIAQDLDVRPEVVREMEGRMTASDAAFDGYQDEDEDTHTNFAPAHYLEDASADPAYQMEQANWEADASYRLQYAMQQLDERSRDILQQRWLQEENKATLHDLAAVYQVSAERIRQLEKNAMQKLRKLMEQAPPALLA